MIYTINKSVEQRSFKFGVLYGKLITQLRKSRWEARLQNASLFKASISAVTLDKDILNKLDYHRDLPLKSEIVEVVGESGFKDFEAYERARKEISDSFTGKINLDFIRNTHSILLAKDEIKSHLRATKRLLPKEISENGVVKQLSLEVKTTPQQIPAKLESFTSWFNEAIPNHSPLILAALTHFRIAEIHPFADGNGRLARVFEQLALSVSKEIEAIYIPTEYYFLQQSETYYSLIESTINSGDCTAWIEFYSEVALKALNDSIRTLRTLSGGAINIEKDHAVALSDIESVILEALIENDALSPVEIANKLGHSRQNIYRVIRLLNQKGLLQKHGSKYQSN